MAGNPSMEGLDLGFVASHFDVVPVRTNDESCIVVRVLMPPQTGRTIVFTARLQSRAARCLTDEANQRRARGRAVRLSEELGVMASDMADSPIIPAAHHCQRLHGDRGHEGGQQDAAQADDDRKHARE